MFTAPSRATSLSLTTWKVLRLRRRSTRYDGYLRRMPHSSSCLQMVSKPLQFNWILFTAIGLGLWCFLMRSWAIHLPRGDSSKLLYNLDFCAVSAVIEDDWSLLCSALLSLSDKTIKLWKISERDKRPEGYNLKEEDGRYRDPNTVTALRVSMKCFVESKVFVSIEQLVL